MLRLILLIVFPLFAYCYPYNMYGGYYPSAYPPPYYVDSRPTLSFPKSKDLVNDDAMGPFVRRVKRQYYYGGYGGYPYGYSNPVGTGSPWALGGGLIGNTISFLVG
ncbi:hypothetical protein GCK32_001136 [Trichostrongylus colubriformis]|uniref:Uncharacterized protein n=1 Tax=Trichostrongylus colubriformis TaxID=6319 RepID=A0AAN8IRQ9_TRICO